MEEMNKSQSSDGAANREQFEYKAEMKQLLHLIIHSLYTHPEIFLRELISNSSDALNKLRFRRLTDTAIIDKELPLEIKISLDKENLMFSIEDSGIGMTRDDLINQIGTIASSGTLAFLNKLKESRQSLDSNMIGQFGVGFYSVFMVTDEITIETRSADSDSKAFKWISQGQNTFEIEESSRTARGTKITFKLKEEYKEFAEEYRVKSIINKYSNFVDFPIFVNENEVNIVNAIWHKKKDAISDEELDNFYKFISNDYQAALGHLVLSIEGNINFKSIVFIPTSAPPALFKDLSDKSLNLYVNRVFIQDNCKELLPDYLRFVKGVVDTEDLPLNVSREVTQNSPVTTKIRNVLTSKILNLLEEWADKDKEKYETFYKNFGSLFKTGINSDFANRTKLIELTRFESSKTKDGELTSFNGYFSRMKDDQKSIYFVSGNHRDLIEKSPNLEYFFKNDIEVIYLTDPVDTFTFPYINEYEGKPLSSIDKSDIDFDKTESKETEPSNDKQQEIIAVIKEVLGDKIEDAIASKRLVNSPVTLVTGKSGMDTQMEKMMQMMDKDFTVSKKIMEVNFDHELIQNIIKLKENNSPREYIDKCIVQLYEGALLVEGYMKNPGEFVTRMFEFMTKATK